MNERAFLYYGAGRGVRRKGGANVSNLREQY